MSSITITPGTYGTGHWAAYANQDKYYTAHSNLSHLAGSLTRNEDLLRYYVQCRPQPWTRETHDRVEEHKATDRSLREQIKAQQEPLWEILATHPHPHLARMAEVRPKFLRAEHAGALAQIIMYALDDVSAELAAAAVAQKDHTPLRIMAGAWMESLREWAGEHPGQLREQLKRVGAHECMRDAHQWILDREAKKTLTGAGTPIVELDIGEVRLMDSGHFDAIGDYLSCCVGNDPQYATRADRLVSAFVCVYPKDVDLPIGLVELKYNNGRIEIAETQSRYSRGGYTWIDAVDEWVFGPTAVTEIATALDVTMGGSTKVETDAYTADYSWWEEGNALAPWGSDVEFDWDGLVEACLSDTSFRDAFSTVAEYATSEQSEAFRAAMSQAVLAS